MDNIYDYIIADHRKVTKLFSLLEKSEQATAKADYLAVIIHELLLHAEAEEATFYKAIESNKTAKGDVLHGKKEHDEIEAQIAVITKCEDLNKNWEDEVIKLKELVEHHVKEEEGDIFKDAKKILSDEEAYIVREKMHDMKEKLLNSTKHADF